MTNSLYYSYVVLNKVYGEGKFIKQAINDAFIEEAHRAFTVKVCYGVLDRDAELSYYIKSLAKKSPKLPVRTILKISMYAIKYLDKKDYFIVESAVELTKKLGKQGASGFVNAFLRKFVSAKIPLPTDEILNLSVKYSYPEFAVKELINDYGKARAESIMSAKYPANTLCFYGTDGEKYLKERGADFSLTPFGNVFAVRNFHRNADYDKGVYTYQVLGSVAICDAVSPCDKLLDCCAAPGGKSVRLSYKVGEVTAWDVHPHRTELIKEYARRMGRTNIDVSVRDAKEFDGRWENYFDAVLCDAPCSGFGVVGDNPDIKINRSEKDVASLIEEQSRILDTVSRYVKKGGYLYYSTCSVFFGENIGVINGFLSKNSDFALTEADSPLKHELIGKTLAFLPDISDGNGFYLAKLKRIK